MVLLHELRDRRRRRQIFDEEDRALRHEHSRRRRVQLFAATDQLGVGGLVGARGLDRLQVVDVFDLRVRADAVVVATEICLPIGEEYRLVLGPSERRQREVPPLSEKQQTEKDDRRDGGVAQVPPVGDEPPARPTEEPTKPVQRVGLGAAVDGRAVGVAGRAVGAGA